MGDLDARHFTGLAYRKIGLAGAGPDWERIWSELRCLLGSGPSWVAVAYADWERAASPPPDAVLDAALRADDCSGILVDTWDKRSASPVDASWGPWIARARRGGRFVALAGGLDEAAILRLAPLGPELFAVRGAASPRRSPRRDRCRSCRPPGPGRPTHVPLTAPTMPAKMIAAPSPSTLTTGENGSRSSGVCKEKAREGRRRATRSGKGPLHRLRPRRRDSASRAASICAPTITATTASAVNETIARTAKPSTILKTQRQRDRLGRSRHSIGGCLQTTWRIGRDCQTQSGPTDLEPDALGSGRSLPRLIVQVCRRM